MRAGSVDPAIFDSTVVSSCQRSEFTPRPDRRLNTSARSPASTNRSAIPSSLLCASSRNLFMSGFGVTVSRAISTAQQRYQGVGGFGPVTSFL